MSTKLPEKFRPFKETKELEETEREKLKKKIYILFFIIELNLFLAGYLAGYPVSGKIIGRIPAKSGSGATLSFKMSFLRRKRQYFNNNSICLNRTHYPKKN